MNTTPTQKLYLASYAKVVMGKIAKHAFPTTGNFHGLKAIFIPTAADPYENQDFVEADKKALEDYGAEVKILDLKSASPTEISQKIAATDILLMAGGDTFYLMDQIIKSGANQAISKFVKNGKIYIGSSAGSIICCPTIEGALEFDNPALAPDLKTFKGLELIPDIIIPHAQKAKYSERIKHTKIKLANKGFQVFTLTDDELHFYNSKSSGQFPSIA